MGHSWTQNRKREKFKDNQTEIKVLGRISEISSALRKKSLSIMTFTEAGDLRWKGRSSQLRKRPHLQNFHEALVLGGYVRKM